MSKKSNKSEVKTVEKSELENKVVLTFSTHKPGNYKKVNWQKLTEAEDGSETGKLALQDASMLTTGRKLLCSKEFQAIVNFQQSLYSRIASNTKGKAIKTFIKEGFYFIEPEQVADIAEIFETAKEQQKELVEKFLAVYESQIAEAEEKYKGGTMFRRSDYRTPEDMRSRFSIEYAFLKFDISPSLPPEIAEREAIKLREAYKKSETLIVQCLTESFEELLSGIQDKLAPGTDGKVKAFHKTLFDDLAEFMSNFNSRNLVNDKDLGALVAKANGILASVRGDKVQDKALVVKSSDELRESTRAQFQAIQEAIEKDIKPKLGRAFNFDLD